MEKWSWISFFRFMITSSSLSSASELVERCARSVTPFLILISFSFLHFIAVSSNRFIVSTESWRRRRSVYLHLRRLPRRPHRPRHCNRSKNKQLIFHRQQKNTQPLLLYGHILYYYCNMFWLFIFFICVS